MERSMKNDVFQLVRVCQKSTQLQLRLLKFLYVWLLLFFDRVHPQVTIKETAMIPIYRPYSTDQMNVLL